MNDYQRTRLLSTLCAIGAYLCAIGACAAFLAAIVLPPPAMPQSPAGQPAELWLVVDGTAIATVKPGGFRYRLAEEVIDIETNELVRGCSQDRIFRDRFQASER